MSESDEYGAAIIVNGKIVAWFAEFPDDSDAREWCTHNHFGEWLAWRAKPPELVPLTPKEEEEIMEEAEILVSYFNPPKQAWQPTRRTIMFNSKQEWREALREGRRFEYDGVVYSYDESRIDRGESPFIRTADDGRTDSIICDWQFYNQVTEIIEPEWMPDSDEVIFVADCKEKLGTVPRLFVEYRAGTEYPWFVKSGTGKDCYKLAAPLPVQVERNRYREALEKIIEDGALWNVMVAKKALNPKGE